MGEEAPGRHSTSGWAKQGRCGVFIYVSRFPGKPVWVETRGLWGNQSTELAPYLATMGDNTGIDSGAGARWDFVGRGPAAGGNMSAVQEQQHQHFLRNSWFSLLLEVHTPRQLRDRIKILKGANVNLGFRCLGCGGIEKCNTYKCRVGVSMSYISECICRLEFELQDWKKINSPRKQKRESQT